MSQTAKLHRWMDLVTALLGSHYGTTLVELRRAVPGYLKGNDESVRRTFERDKDELKALGVAIEVKGTDGDPEPRYTIASDRFYLPYLAVVTARGTVAPKRVDKFGYRALQQWPLTDDELQLITDAASRVASFGDPVLTRDAAFALKKLALDIPPAMLTATPGVAMMPTLPAADPEVLTQLGDALRRRKQVTFSYYGIERDETERRTVLPYGLAFTSGHWYLHGQDPGRGALRRFRVSRMREVSINTNAAKSQDYEIPASFKLADHAAVVPAWELGEDAAQEVTVRFVRNNGAVRTARALGTKVKDHADQSRYLVRRREPFLRWVLGLGGDAEPVGPPDVVRAYRDLVSRTLKAATAT